MQPAVDLLRGKHGEEMCFISTAGNKRSGGKNSSCHRSQSKTFTAVPLTSVRNKPGKISC